MAMVCDKSLLHGELVNDEGYHRRRILGSDGNWKIGIGHRLKGNQFPPQIWAAIKGENPYLDNALLDDQAELSGATIDLIFANDVVDATVSLYRILPQWDQLGEIRKRALINLSFQCQYGELLQFKEFWIAMKASHFAAAAAIMQTSLQHGDWKPARALRVARQVAIGE